MKLLIVTVVEQFEKEILQLFKKSNIESFSGSDIDGYKNPTAMVRTSTCRLLFGLIKEFNTNLETNNPIKAVVVPIERSI